MLFSSMLSPERAHLHHLPISDTFSTAVRRYEYSTPAHSCYTSCSPTVSVQFRFPLKFNRYFPHIPNLFHFIDVGTLHKLVPIKMQTIITVEMFQTTCINTTGPQLCNITLKDAHLKHVIHAHAVFLCIHIYIFSSS